MEVKVRERRKGSFVASAGAAVCRAARAAADAAACMIESDLLCGAVQHE